MSVVLAPEGCNFSRRFQRLCDSYAMVHFECLFTGPGSRADGFGEAPWLLCPISDGQFLYLLAVWLHSAHLCAEYSAHTPRADCHDGAADARHRGGLGVDLPQ